mmetsp:Transcript_12631/g.24756  ORF Transcript_12631/g.24756 Transcript_12631/m.24756 type:complete len:88 (-) Transcript_12631:2-265(-)
MCWSLLWEWFDFVCWDGFICGCGSGFPMDVCALVFGAAGVLGDLHWACLAISTCVQHPFQTSAYKWRTFFIQHLFQTLERKAMSDAV